MIYLRRKPLSRRAVLRGVMNGVGLSLALPPLEAMFNANGTAYACGGVIPVRFGLFFWGNGNNPDFWTPTGEGSGDEWSLSEQLAPLETLKDDITVVSGMSVKIPNVVPHGSGVAGILTGAPTVSVGEDDTYSEPSIDQVIAEQIGGETIYSSLQTAASDTYGLSYNGPSSRNPAETDPYAFYQRIFGDTFREPGSEGLVDPTLGLRRSVLDSVMNDVSALRGRVGAADQARLDQHLDGIRELEQRLARLEEDPPNLESCARPGEPAASYPDVDGRVAVSDRNRVMSDMIAMALACDQTRVVAHFLTEPINNILWPGASDGHHNLTHDESGDQPQVHAITVQCITELAYFLNALKAVPEGDTTLLDNCAILACSEVSKGQLHLLDEMPIVIGGSACGMLRTGMHYRSYSKENASKVLLSLIRAVGIPAAEFGTDEAWTDESLTDIET